MAFSIPSFNESENDYFESNFPFSAPSSCQLRLRPPHRWPPSPHVLQGADGGGEEDGEDEEEVLDRQEEQQGVNDSYSCS